MNYMFFFVFSLLSADVQVMYEVQISISTFFVCVHHSDCTSMFLTFLQLFLVFQESPQDPHSHMSTASSSICHVSEQFMHITEETHTLEATNSNKRYAASFHMTFIAKLTSW
jgi:hypothetical protein